MKSILIVLTILSLLAVVGMLIFVYVVQNVEQPDYTLIAQDGAFEIRDYPALVVAEVRTKGDRQQGLSSGFQPLARYIFAKERGGEQKIAMTAPVLQQAPTSASNQRIAMTAPVIQSPADDDQWAVRFIMPSKFQLADLPAPAGNDIRLQEIPARRMATVRFSGRTTDMLMMDQERMLTEWIQARELQAVGPPLYAYYNDPFTPGFLRRNEVMIEVGGN
ncbi:MAG TPA: heme-binding protein [Chromatiaceae bacterium]|jgi:DNA gyrase inhibitor GyrI|nr:MAG: hypothetical protein N838_00575 [Thiohalocapsa sp. PB-PSB1]QQO56548.1 MAG: heme-binding protein [Thiohalocapsa sp. PB-PSB1]HBG96933.1 heme-binding protein [Chromatiaceae bacterium]HCS91313.1 heme-binding protein [Chromatiaceae bacterium]